VLLFLCLPRCSRRIVQCSYASLTCRLSRGSKTVGLQIFSEEVQEMTESVREDLIVSLAVWTYSIKHGSRPALVSL
jgi:hypothetical protein